MHPNRRVRFSPGQDVPLLAAILVGIVAAVATSLFKEALEASGWMMFKTDADIVTVFAGLALFWRVLIPTLGGLVAGALLAIVARLEAAQPRAADYMEAVASGSGRLPVRVTLLRALSSFCSIVTGSSVGKEGAMIQLAALSGSVFPLMRGGGRPDNDTRLRRMLTACAASAGLASVYHTPLSAAVFVAEVVFGEVDVQLLMPLFLASAAGTVVSQFHGGMHALYPGLIVPSELLQWPMLVASAALGLLAGVAGALFMRSSSLAKGAFARLPGGWMPRLALGGALVGLLALWVPEVVGNGYSTIQAILQRHPLTATLLAVLLAKLLATVLSIGSGAVGGVFTPSLFIGAALGQLFAAVVPGSTAAPLLPLVGMCAFLAATSQAPLMSVLMVFEMTLAPTLLLPGMIGAVAAYYAASRFQALSLYSVVAERTRASAADERARTLTLVDLFEATTTTIGPDATLQQASDKFAETGTRYLYVVGLDSSFMGALSIHAVQRALREQPDADVFELCEKDFPTLTLASLLPDAQLLFMQHALNRIPLIRDATGRELIGTISKSRVLKETSGLF